MSSMMCGMSVVSVLLAAVGCAQVGDADLGRAPRLGRTQVALQSEDAEKPEESELIAQESASPMEPAISLPSGADEEQILLQLSSVRYGDTQQDAQRSAQQIQELAGVFSAELGPIQAIEAVLHVNALHDLPSATTLSLVTKMALGTENAVEVEERLVSLYEEAEAIGRQARTAEGGLVSEAAGKSFARHLRVAILKGLTGTASPRALRLLERERSDHTSVRLRRAAGRALGRPIQDGDL